MHGCSRAGGPRAALVETRDPRSAQDLGALVCERQFDAGCGRQRTEEHASKPEVANLLVQGHAEQQSVDSAPHDPMLCVVQFFFFSVLM